MFRGGAERPGKGDLRACRVHTAEAHLAEQDQTIGRLLQGQDLSGQELGLPDPAGGKGLRGSLPELRGSRVGARTGKADERQHGQAGKARQAGQHPPEAPLPFHGTSSRTRVSWEKVTPRRVPRRGKPRRGWRAPPGAGHRPAFRPPGRAACSHPRAPGQSSSGNPKGRSGRWCSAGARGPAPP